MTFFWSLLGLIILQRITELLIAKRNEKLLRDRGAVEYDRKGYKVIVVMHILFFISIIAERNLRHTEINEFWYVYLTLFAIAQFVRYWAILSLGTRWNTKILVLPDSKLIAGGAYKYFKHPNYIAVITEIAVIPLIFSCYLTAIFFAVLNAILLNRRINIEERALQPQN